MEKLDKLQKILDVADREFLKADDVEQVIQLFLNVVKELKVIIDKHISDTKREVGSSLEDAKSTFSGLEKQMTSILKGTEGTSVAKVKEMAETLSSEMVRMEAMIPDMPDLTPLVTRIATLEIKDITPNEVITKINQGTELIKKERVEGLDGELKRIDSRIQVGGRSVGGLTGLYLYVDGSKKGIVKSLNIKAGTGTVLTYGQTNGLETVTISASAVSAGYQSPTGTVNGINKTFVFTTAPNVILVDGITMRATASDSTVNWTGTTTVVLTVAPNFEIFSVA